MLLPGGSCLLKNKENSPGAAHALHILQSWSTRRWTPSREKRGIKAVAGRTAVNTWMVSQGQYEYDQDQGKSIPPTPDTTSLHTCLSCLHFCAYCYLFQSHMIPAGQPGNYQTSCLVPVPQYITPYPWLFRKKKKNYVISFCFSPGVLNS